ncbi:molybdate ABC transporter substrate-binding protein [Nitrospira sp. Nam74]
MAGILKFGVAMAVISGLAGVVATGDAVWAETLTIGAAHSLKPAFQEIVPMFEKEYGANVSVVYGPSHTLRRQIEKGAAIDVFLPAAVDDVEQLHKKGLTLKGGPRIYAQSSLVLIMSSGSRATPISFHEALNSASRLAIADPKVSTLGEITARVLTKLDPAYKNHFNLVHAQHSEDVVALVATGKAYVGLIYRTDAINSGQVRIIDETPTGTYTPVQFGEAVVWTCRTAALDVAEEFLNFMMSPRIQKLLLKYGFDAAPSNG